MPTAASSTRRQGLRPRRGQQLDTAVQNLNLDTTDTPKSKSNNKNKNSKVHMPLIERTTIVCNSKANGIISGSTIQLQQKVESNNAYVDGPVAGKQVKKEIKPEVNSKVTIDLEEGDYQEYNHENGGLEVPIDKVKIQSVDNISSSKVEASMQAPDVAMSKSRISSSRTSSQPASSLAIDRDSSRSPNPPISMLHHSSVSSTNPALTLPVVNLGFDELREQMNRFTIRFDEFIEKGRRRLLEDKNEFARNIAEDKESAREKKAQIEYYKEQEAEVLEQSRREDEEFQEAQATINSMRRTYNDLSTTQAHLTAHISTLSSTIASKRNHLAKQRSNLTQLSTTNAPELSFWEDNLGMRIEGAGVTDHLKIVFTHIHERDWDKEFVFVISLEKRDYSVVLCKPKLPQEYIDRTVQRLNESRGFGGFLKDMRIGFVELAKSGMVDVGK